MIKIIKKGYKIKPEDIIYVKKCYVCGCKFTYQLYDLHMGYDDVYITCPDCGYYCNIFFKKKYKGDKIGDKQ